MSVNQSRRRHRDAELEAKANTGNQNTTTYTKAFDMGSPHKALESVELEIKLAVNPDLADAQTVTVSVMENDTYDANDGATDVQNNFAVASMNVDTVQTGAGGTGAAEKIARLRPTTETKRFLALRIVTSATAGASVSGKECRLRALS